MASLIAILDDDATAEPDWLERLGEHVRDRAVIAAGGLSLPELATETAVLVPHGIRLLVGCSYAGMAQHAVAVRNVWTCLCARREYLVDAGGFRNDLGARWNTADGR